MLGTLAASRRTGSVVFTLVAAAFAALSRPAAAVPGQWEWLSSRQGPGEFVYPKGAYAGPDGALYVSDTMAHQIQRREASGSWHVIATVGDQPGETRTPDSLGITGDGTLYVVDRGNKRLQSRRPDGTWRVVAYPDLGGAQPSPALVAVGSDGTLYLVNGSSASMALWTRAPSGEWTNTGQTWPASSDDPKVPYQMAVDPKGGLFVVEDVYGGSLGGRLRHWSATGGWTDVAPAGMGVGSLQKVGGLAVTSTGDVYVLDDIWDGGRIQKRDSQGNWTEISVPVEEKPLYGDLAADASGNVYLCDKVGRTVWWRSPGGLWSQIGFTGRAPGQIDFNLMWDVDPAGRVYLGQSIGTAWGRGSDGSIHIAGGDARVDVRSGGGVWQRAAEIGLQTGKVFSLVGVAASPTGELYAAEEDPLGRLQMRSDDGSWTALGSSSPIGGFNINYFLSSLAVDAQGTLWEAVTGWAGTNQAMQLTTRSSAGQWTTLIPLQAGPYTDPHVLPDGTGGCYLWSHAAAVSEAGGKAWPQHFDGKVWQDLQELGSVRELAVGPRGEFYVVTRDAGELWQVGPQGDRVRLASAGWGLGQVPPGVQLLRCDSLGRLYLCSPDGVQRYTPPSALVRGDVDGDGQVAIADVLLALKVVAGLVPSTPTLELRADVSPAGTGDGKLSIADVARLLRYLAGLETRP